MKPTPPVNPYVKIQTACQSVMAVALLVAGAYWFRDVMMPFALAAFLALNLSTLIDLQTEKLKLPRTLAVWVTLSLGILLVFLLSLIVSGSVSDLANKSGQYLQGFNEMWISMSESLTRIPGWENLREHTGIDQAQVTQRVTASVTSGLGSAISSLTGSVLNLLSQSLVVALFLGFMVAGGHTRKGPAPGVWGEIEVRIKQYVVVQTALSALTGGLISLTLSMLGVDLAIVFGVLAFVLNFIPNLGSLISTALPLPIILFSPGMTTTERVLAVVIPGVIQFVIGNILNPKVMAKSLDLHPVVILFTLMVGSAIWGVVGMFLATPITAMIKIFCEKFDSTRPVSLLLAGKPSALLAQLEI